MAWVAAVAQVPSLAQEVPHAMGMAEKKKKESEREYPFLSYDFFNHENVLPIIKENK